MEIGIDRISSLEKSFTSKRLLDNSNKCVLDIKLESQNKKQLVDLNLYNDQDDEGEIMLLAMILLQLHGVKLPSVESISEDNGENGEEEDKDSLNKKKRQRTSPDQLLILEEIFETDRMPNPQTRGHLADQLGMSSRRVQIWFQNKRAKVKREVSGAKPDGYSSADSSCSISPSSSPSSPSVPSNDLSPISSPSHGIAVVPQINSCKSLQSPTSSIIIPSAISKPFLPSTTNIIPTVPSTTSTIIDNTTKQLKAQQLQFSRTAPFVETQPVLTASY